jgi:hypothetical protein
MFDYPGLVAPQVVSVLRDHGLGMAAPVAILQPEWLVLRPDEVPRALPTADGRRRYRLARVFDTSAELGMHTRDRSLLRNATFIVWQRRQ